MGTLKNMFHSYSLYRYGERRPITLAGSPPPGRLLRGQRRQRVVDQAVEILKGWRTSPFQHEAAVRVGLRSALCLEGARWARADSEAELIVAEGLCLIGAERPSWEDGQPRYIDRGDFCVRCGKPMPDDLAAGVRNQRFCSAECAAAELDDRHRHDGSVSNRVVRAAQSLIRRELIPQSTCERCGKLFRPMKPELHGLQRFCSKGCSAAARALHPEIECLACGATFRTRRKSSGQMQKFCSPRCVEAYGRTMDYRRICEACGSPFVTKAPNGRFCSASCKTFESKHTRGVYVRKSLSVRLFDYLFTAPIALAAAAPRVTRRPNCST